MENKTHKILLFNDTEHDFLYVIACLIKFCNHDAIQAEQCALIAHNNGSAEIASGNFMDMLEINSSLSNMKMITEVKEYV